MSRDSYNNNNEVLIDEQVNRKCYVGLNNRNLLQCSTLDSGSDMQQNCWHEYNFTKSQPLNKRPNQLQQVNVCTHSMPDIYSPWQHTHSLAGRSDYSIINNTSSSLSQFPVPEAEFLQESLSRKTGQLAQIRDGQMERLDNSLLYKKVDTQDSITYPQYISCVDELSTTKRTQGESTTNEKCVLGNSNSVSHEVNYIFNNWGDTNLEKCQEDMSTINQELENGDQLVIISDGKMKNIQRATPERIQQMKNFDLTSEKTATYMHVFLDDWGAANKQKTNATNSDKPTMHPCSKRRLHSGEGLTSCSRILTDSVHGSDSVRSFLKFQKPGISNNDKSKPCRKVSNAKQRICIRRSRVRNPAGADHTMSCATRAVGKKRVIISYLKIIAVSSKLFKCYVGKYLMSVSEAFFYFNDMLMHSWNN